ncbi:MAG: two-component system, NtrC family, sensor kinase [Chloroflexota bacterium]|jgi:signal transduction histidine kinase|nr:two-component system, NtrC family, sensor kinase [Chloroflexota bacterium]
MGLARKLVLAMVTGVLLVVIVHGYFAVRDDMRDFQNRIDDDVATLGYGLSITLPRVVRDSGPAQAEDLIARRNQGDRVLIRWVALDIPPTDRRAVDLPLPLIADLRQGKMVRLIRGRGPAERLFVYRPFFGQQPVHDLAEASESLAPLHQRERSRVVGIAVESLVILLLAIGSALVFGFRFVARPVQILVGQARRIGRGDLSQRLELPGHHELSELAGEMNLMCDRLLETRERLAAESGAKIAAVEQLRHADRVARVGQLASGVAHELGTPLNVVAGHAGMITSAAGTRDDDRDSAQVIAEQAARMTGIIRQLLDFARRGQPQLQNRELAPVVDRTVKMLAHLAMQRHVELCFSPARTTARVHMDEAQMQQVVANLVLNAIQAMPDGGRVDIALDQARAGKPDGHSGQGDYVRLAVSDQGVGIAPENLPHIFEPFFTTKGVGDGTGLGLSVCHGIVEEHGGWIAVDSNAGSGSRFTVFLPALIDPPT